jgi:hypothetical protein
VTGDSDNTSTSSDDISISTGLTLTSAGAISLSATTNGIQVLGAITLNAANGVTFNNSATSTATGNVTVDADTDNNGTGDFTLASGAAIDFSTNNNAFILTASDATISGTINTGGAALIITPSDGGTLGLGDATCGGTCGMTITGAEIQNLTSASATMVFGDSGTTTTGNIFVDNITLANVANITGGPTIAALKDNSSITFLGSKSTFLASVNAQADDGITINVDVEATGSTATFDGDADNSADSSDKIVIADGVTLTSSNVGGRVQLDATSGGIEALGSVTLNGHNGVTINDNFTSTGTGTITIDADADNTGTGDFVLASGATLDTNNNDISITADDFTLTGDKIDAGSGDLTILASTAVDINVGFSGTGMSIETTDLSKITANNLTIGGSTNDLVTIRGVSASDTDLITGTITFNATKAGQLISIDTTASVFENSVTFNGNANVNVNVDLTSDSGSLIFEGDSDNITSGAVNISAGVTITATLGSITLDATTGGLSAGGAITLNAANGITINDGVTSSGTGNVTIDADTDDNGTGDFTLASGAAINFSTNNNFLSVTANDLDIQGTINTGTATTTLLVSNGGTIGLGDTAGTMTISGSELQNITAANVDIGSSTAGNITVNNITLANTANISATLSMTTGGDLAFNTGASSITNKLAISAGGDITQDVSLFTGGTFNFTVTGTNVATLNNASNDFTGDITANSGTGAVEFSETTGTTFLASTLGGDLTVVTTSDIDTSGIMTVGGDASFTTSNGSLNLNTSGNNLGAKLTLSATDWVLN